MRKQSYSSRMPFSPSLQTNVRTFYSRFGGSSDLVIRAFRSEASSKRELAVLYLDGIVDKTIVNESIIKPLMSLRLHPTTEKKGDKLLQTLRSSIVSVGLVKNVRTIDEALQQIADGLCLIIADGSVVALTADVSGRKERTIASSQTETVVDGPHQKFVEHTATNIGLVRRIIRSSDLHVQTHRMGSRTNSDVTVLYLHGTADEGMVKEVFRRLAEINIDGVLNSGYIERLIEDESFTLFPTLLHTERPDAVAAALLEGRVAIMADGSPIALIAPTTFFNFFQFVEDSFQGLANTSFVRMIRYMAYILSMFLPSLYIAVTTFHPNMLPTQLLISLSAQREIVPFPGLVEAFILELAFEVLREAGLRIPRTIGTAFLIVGALASGLIAVQAGILSAGIVIVVSISAISSFVIPQFNMAANSRIIRYGILLMAGLLGFFGIFVAALLLLIHLTSLRSFGVPYMSPIAAAPYNQALWRDAFTRPWQLIAGRSFDSKLRNQRRQSSRKKTAAQRHSGKP